MVGIDRSHDLLIRRFNHCQLSSFPSFSKLASLKSSAMTNEEFLESISEVGEIWKPVVGYEDLFIVSSTGKIVSLSRVVDRKRYKFVKPPTLLSIFLDKQGYPVVNLTIPPRHTIHRFVHRLVAESFIPNPYQYPCVDHIDANPKNSHIDNLRWCSYSMNNMNPITRKRNSDAKKGKIPTNAKPVIRINLQDPLDVKVFPSASVEGFSQSHICSCCLGKRQSHKGYKWMRLSDYETSKSTMSKNSYK